jgi:hypothetical protein
VGHRATSRCIKADDFAYPALISRGQGLDIQVDRRPSAHQVGGVAQDIENFLRSTLDTPVRNEVIVVTGHG